MPSFYPGPDDAVTPEMITLDRLKIGGRWPLALNPDVGQSLMVSLRDSDEMQRLMYGALLEIKAHIYKENLPPESVQGTKVIRWHKTVPHTEWFLDGPYQRWKGRHVDSWWYPHWLLGAPRRISRSWQVKVSDDQVVTLEVDLRRYRTYPESSLGPPVGALGNKVVLGHFPPVTRWLGHRDGEQV